LGEKLTRPFRRGTKGSHNQRQRRRSFVDAEASAPLLAEAQSSSVSTTSSSAHAASKPVTMRDIFAPQTTINLICYTFLALHSVAYDQILPVFLNYPRVVPDETNTQLPFKFTGGFGLSSDKIGTVYTIYGIACGVIQFLMVPWLCARFGVLNLYRFASKLMLKQTNSFQLPIFFFFSLLFTNVFIKLSSFPSSTSSSPTPL